MSVGRVWQNVALAAAGWLPLAGSICLIAQEPLAQEPSAEQMDLGVRVVAAASRFDQTDLRELVAAAALDDLFVAVAARRADLPGGSRDRVVAALATRRTEIWASWDERPECRRRWASVLAKCEWFHDESVARHAAADADERVDFEFVAAQAVPAVFESWLRHRDARLQASGRALYRAAATGQIEQVEACTAVAREQSAFHVWAFVANDRYRVSPFVLRGALADPDDRVRARASWALRRLLKYEQRPEIVAMLGEETHIPRLGLNERTARRMARALDAGRSPAGAMVRSTTQGALPAAARRRLARAFLAAAERVPPDPDPKGRKPGPSGASGSRVRAPTPEFQLATEYFRQAAELHPEHYRTVLGLAANADTGDVTVRAMHALAQLDTMPLAVAQRSAGIVLALLDHGDARVEDAAAILADRLLAQTADSALLDRLVAIAVDALDQDRARLFFARARSTICMMGPPPVGPPANRPSQALFTAASHHATPLAEPLMAALESALAAKNRPRRARMPNTLDTSASHRRLLLECVVRLAPALSPPEAKRLFKLLHPRLGGAGLGFAPTSDPESVLIPAAIRALFVSVPEEVLPAYDEALAGEDERHSLLLDLRRLDVVPAERAQHVLQTGCDRHAVQAVGVFAPDVLVREWRAGGQRRQDLAWALSGLSPDRWERLIALASGGQVPKELAVRALGNSFRSLPELAAILPADRATADEWGPGLAGSIARASPSSPADDLRALRALGAATALEVGLAVIRRSSALGEAGREIAAEVVERQLGQSESRALAAVVGAALLANLPIPNLGGLTDRLPASGRKGSTNPSPILVAAQLRLDPAARLRASPRVRPAEVALAGIDVDEATIREIYPALRQEQLAGFLAGSPVTRRSALELAAEQPTWSTALERDVVHQTLHVDAGVRLAAYRALASRDPGLWRCGLLVHEGVLDSDPRIRALAQEHER